MKYYLTLLISILIAIIISSCTSQIIDMPINSVRASDFTPSQDVISQAVFHNMTESWIVPQKDPYALSNFQQAYTNLISENHKDVLTKGEQNRLSAITLQATHYALRIFPRNEDEQWEIELMDDIKVSYLPFNYIQLPDEEAKQFNIPTKGASECFNEEVKYTVTYSDLEVDGMPVEDEVIDMPVLYVVWPITKGLPSKYDFVIDYEVYIPDYSIGTKGIDLSLLQLLEDEAIKIALGDRAKTKSVLDNVVKTLKGEVKTYDSFIDQYVPLENLKIRFQLGSNIYDTYTQSDGSFSITEAIDASASFMHILQHPRWKITPNNSTSPKSVTWGTVEEYWSEKDEIFQGVLSVPSYYETLPAINYYYSRKHSIRTWYYDSGIRIKIAGETNASASASFTYSKTAAAYITVYENYAGDPSYLNGAILHELGHFTQYGERGGYSNYVATHKLLRESFASYVGNYLCDRYYYLLGYTNTASPQTSFTGQSRQYWTKTGTSVYSPLFVDLFDSYNQKTSAGSSYNQDMINGFSHSIVRTIAAECPTWTDVKSILSEYIGTYYSETAYNEYIAPYDYWFANN